LQVGQRFIEFLFRWWMRVAIERIERKKKGDFLSRPRGRTKQERQFESE
jgi:hypothetical protein